MIDELNLPASTNLQLPLPVDGRALKIAHALISNPADTRNQTALAKAFGLSTRTLSRLFTEQTGLTFACWRQQARILSSLQLLVKGESVANVAFASGYDNVSSYIAVFRQRFGVTPKSYFPHSAPPWGANLRGQAPHLNVKTQCSLPEPDVPLTPSKPKKFTSLRTKIHGE
ncbi:helix-turn-helix domain-containing protein [Vibrio sp. PP-XX7]